MPFCIFSGKPCPCETHSTRTGAMHLRKQSQFKLKGRRTRGARRENAACLSQYWLRTGGGLEAERSASDLGDFPAGEAETEQAETEQAQRAGLRHPVIRRRRFRRPEERPRLDRLGQRPAGVGRQCGEDRHFGARHASGCDGCDDGCCHPGSHITSREHSPDARTLEQQVGLGLTAQFQIGGPDDGGRCRRRERCDCRSRTGRNAVGAGRRAGHYGAGALGATRAGRIVIVPVRAYSAAAFSMRRISSAVSGTGSFR